MRLILLSNKEKLNYQVIFLHTGVAILLLFFSLVFLFRTHFFSLFSTSFHRITVSFCRFDQVVKCVRIFFVALLKKLILIRHT